jgi:hypothetical protein
VTDPVVGLEACSALAAAGGLALAHGAVRRDQALRAGGATYRVVLPAEFPDGGIEQFLLGLHGALRPRLRRLVEGQPWLSVELAASEAGIELRVWVPEAIGEGFLTSQLRAALPGGRLEPVDEAALEGAAAGGWVVGRGAGLLRIATATPGLAALTTGLRGLAAGEQGLFQVIVELQSPRAQAHMLTLADQLQHGHKTKDGTRVAPTLAERARASRLRDKAARPLFACSFRILAVAPTRATARRRVAVIASGLHGFATAESHFARRPVVRQKRFRRAVAERRRVRIPAPTLLNSGELAAMLSMTPAVAREAGLAIVASRQLAPPPGVASRGRVFGVAATSSGDRPVAIDEASSTRHLAISAPTGAGKTELLLSLATQDIHRGVSTIVIDPKGGLTEQLLMRVPEERREDVVLFETAADGWAVGINVLEIRPGDDPYRVCDDLVAILHEIFKDSWGPRSADILRACLLTLLRIPGSTLIELPLLLMDDEFRRPYLEGLDDPVGLGSFWGWWAGLSPAARNEYGGPVMNKLRQFLLAPALRAILGQRRSTIDFDHILNHRGILLADLAPASLGHEATRLIGSLLVALLWQAIQRRSALPPAARPFAAVYLDEFQQLAAISQDLEAALALSRGHNIGLTLAHQHTGQLSPQLRDAMLANARSKIVFELSATDSHVFAREFTPHLTEADLRGLGRFEIACAILSEGTTSRPFTARTLPAPPPIRSDTHQLREHAKRRHALPRAKAEAEIRARLTRPTDSASEARFGRRVVTDRVTDRLHEDGPQTAQPGPSTSGTGNDYSTGLHT